MASFGIPLAKMNQILQRGSAVQDLIFQHISEAHQKFGSQRIQAVALWHEDYYCLCHHVREQIVDKDSAPYVFDRITLNTPDGEILVYPHNLISPQWIYKWSALVQIVASEKIGPNLVKLASVDQKLPLLEGIPGRK